MKQKKKRRSAPPKLQAIQTSRHFHMAHKRHTGHVLPRHSTSYPILAMLLLCTGVFLTSWTRIVSADNPYGPPQSGDYSVTASVPGPPPSAPATITNVTDNATYSSQPITVSGDCPINTYESLFRNGYFSGVALCDVTGTFSLQTALFTGANKLVIQDYSQTDEAGPTSAAFTVMYTPPESSPDSEAGTPSSSSNSASSSSSSTSTPMVNSSPSSQAAAISLPLILKTSFVYQGYYTGTATTWQIDIEGGTAPYAIAVSWGDGQHSLLSQPKAGLLPLNHTYTKAGGYKGSFTVNLTVSDAAGRNTYLQLLAIVNNPPSAAVGVVQHHPTTGGLESLGSGYVTDVKHYVWPSYGFVVLLLFSFWLGERREYKRLTPRLRPVRVRATRHRSSRA